MTSYVPARLKAADLARFIVRASQLENARPVIAYWCEYWVVNQIISKGLHNDDPDTHGYTTTLMNKLEKVKAESTMNDAIVDDAAGQAYVEQFGLETFMRADRAIQANRVTKQTADTFLAAATFLELVNIWEAPDDETAAKMKYAKWNAVRIMKAIKEGRDPNETNPQPELAARDELPTLDPDDPEVQALSSKQPFVEDITDEQDQIEARMARESSLDYSLHPSAHVSSRVSPSRPTRKTYIESVPDEQDQVEARLAKRSIIDQSLHPSAQVSNHGSPTQITSKSSTDGFSYTGADNVSPIEQSPNEHEGVPVDDGYFPNVPSAASETPDPSTLTAPASGGTSISAIHSMRSRPDPAMPSPQAFYGQRRQQLRRPAFPEQPTGASQVSTVSPKPSSPSASVSAGVDNANLKTDDIAVAQAQKHARFAISALNFEDADTAVKELRAALQTLGAQ